MKLHTLRPAKGAVKSKTRIGRGQGSGKGGTSARGHKGQKSRSGYSRKKGFEGGQMPLQRRIPKRGFKNINRLEYVALNIGKIQEIADKHNLTSIDIDALYKLGYIKKNDLVKVLAYGELTQGVSISAHKCSAKAKELVEKAGGSISLLNAE